MSSIRSEHGAALHVAGGSWGFYRRFCTGAGFTTALEQACVHSRTHRRSIAAGSFVNPGVLDRAVEGTTLTETGEKAFHRRPFQGGGAAAAALARGDTRREPAKILRRNGGTANVRAVANRTRLDAQDEHA